MDSDCNAKNWLICRFGWHGFNLDDVLLTYYGSLGFVILSLGFVIPA